MGGAAGGRTVAPTTREGGSMSPALQVIVVLAASIALGVGLIVTIALEIFEEHEINVERRRLPVSHR
jgi:hypothetical protein